MYRQSDEIPLYKRFQINLSIFLLKIIYLSFHSICMIVLDKRTKKILEIKEKTFYKFKVLIVAGILCETAHYC